MSKVIYVANNGEKYPATIINEEEWYCDIELDPQVESTTMLHVLKHKIEAIQ